MWLRKFDKLRRTVNIDWRERIISAINQTLGFVGTEEHLVKMGTCIIGTSNALQPREESSGFNNHLWEIFKQKRLTTLNACFEKGIENPS